MIYFESENSTIIQQYTKAGMLIDSVFFPDMPKRIDYIDGAEILDEDGAGTGEFEQMPVEVDAYQELLDKETAGEIVIQRLTAEDKAAKIEAELVVEADQFVLAEMSIADKAINAHVEGAARVVSTKTKWINYKNKLRDYVQIVAGVRTIMTTKPVRPT